MISAEPSDSKIQNDYCAIEDYAIVGDGRSAALVSLDGSIDWLCWPCFDSPAIFASLLGRKIGGLWQVSPTSPFKASRTYVNGTNVLETPGFLTLNYGAKTPVSILLSHVIFGSVFGSFCRA